MRIGSVLSQTRSPPNRTRRLRPSAHITSAGPSLRSIGERGRSPGALRSDNTNSQASRRSHYAVSRPCRLISCRASVHLRSSATLATLATLTRESKTLPLLRLHRLWRLTTGGQPSPIETRRTENAGKSAPSCDAHCYATRCQPLALYQSISSCAILARRFICLANLT